MKKILFIKPKVMKNLVILFSFCCCLHLNAQIVVQVGAFEKSVPTTYFEGLDGVYLSIDQNNIHHYYIKGFASESSAQETAQKAISLGYTNSHVVDLSKYGKCTCNISRRPPPSPYSQIRNLKSIFFDFDKSFLRFTSKSELDKLYTILIENPNYTTELRAHTDAKGSIEYNRALSQRRSDSAKNYLISKGISSSRIRTNTYGEETPIAKNDVNGADTEEGRQLNRRVELLVFDSNGKNLNEMVEEIDVPDYLRN